MDDKKKTKMYKASRRNELSALCTVLALAAVSPVGAQTLTAVMQSPLRVLDPVVTTAHITAGHGYMIYDTLLATDADNQIQPQMVKSWSVSEDRKTYTFVLREGLKWHDDTPVTSADCVASIERWAQRDQTGRIMLSLMEDMKELDDQTFQLTFTRPTDIVLRALSRTGSSPAFMMPKDAAQASPTQAINSTIGSGPFRFVTDEFRPGIKAVYEKNKDYIPRTEPASGSAGGKVVNVDRVEWISMPDPMTAINSLVNEEIDFIESVPYDLVPFVEAQEGIQVESTNKLGFQYVYRFNFLNPPMNNKLLRQAAMYAINPDDIVKSIVGKPEFYKPCVAVFGCGMPYESEIGKEIIQGTNLEKAKALVKEANYDGTPVVILQPADFPDLAVPPVVITQALRAAGFTVDLQAMDWQTLVTRRTSQEPNEKGGWNILATNNLISDIQNPVSNFQIAANGREGWPGWPDFPELETIRKNFAESDNSDEMKELAEEAQRFVVDEGIIVPLGQALRPTAYRTVLSDLPNGPLPFFWSIQKASD